MQIAMTTFFYGAYVTDGEVVMSVGVLDEYDDSYEVIGNKWEVEE